jgi:hypothetical protein
MGKIRSDTNPPEAEEASSMLADAILGELLPLNNERRLHRSKKTNHAFQMPIRTGRQCGYRMMGIAR